MKKLALATIVISISMSLAGCNNATNLTTENKINEKITIDQAKEIALKHSNLTSDEVSFIKAEKDMDNGIEKYDIEFYYNNKEYDYEINAANGEIINYDYDIENYNISGQQQSNSQQQQNTQQQSNSQPQNNQQQTNTSNISVDKAKEIALNHAGLAANQVSFIKAEKDMDDGIEKYDIEFYHNNKEYDYEINAVNGQIISYDHDVENYNIQSPQQSNSQPQNNQQQTNTSNISVDKAKEIALNHAGLASNQVSFVKAEKDMDDGIVKYDIEFYYNNREYNYEINANNGNIISYEQD